MSGEKVESLDEIIEILKRITTERVSDTDLYWQARSVLDSELERSFDVNDFFSEVRDSTKHSATLGAGPELLYDYLKKDALKLLEDLSQ